jgi:ubiquinone/menaquinone biosynthesis C-methylase UbiE
MNPNQDLWEKGDFTKIAATMRDSGEALVAGVAKSLPMRALDLGCGDGTTAIPLATFGADVLGVDIARNLVAAGNKRAALEGLSNVRFEEGDACKLEGLSDAMFDLTMSVFGAMFAPRPFEVAQEMVRVTKPGGTIVMGNWIPNDPTSFVSQVLKISSAFVPPPPEGVVSPMTWGVESHVLERFGKAGIAEKNIAMTKDTFFFTGSMTAEQLIDLFKTYYGPTMNAFDAAAKTGRTQELLTQLVELAHAQNTVTDGTVHIGATFLKVTISC